MNLYFLVEGRRTEAKVYPRWLEHLLPHFSRVARYADARDHHYHLASGYGYPSLLHNHLRNAVAEACEAQRYAHLVLCLDADEFTVQERCDEVTGFIAREGIMLGSTQLQIVVQNRCIETWFLGNRKALTRAPEGRLRDYVRYYDVSEQDPEAMGCHPEFSRHADFHGEYVRAMLGARGVPYSKEIPRHVSDKAYLEQLLLRCETCPADLPTFRAFVQFCAQLIPVKPPAPPAYTPRP